MPCRIEQHMMCRCRYPPETYVSYLNSATVQAAIGAYVNYTEESTAVALAFNTTGDDGRLDGITSNFRALVRQGVAVNPPPRYLYQSATHIRLGHNDIRRRRLQQ